MSESHAWAFFYQYGVGGAFFVICVFLLVKARALDLRQPSGRRGLALLLAGYILYAGVHALSVFWLPGL